MDGKSNMLLNDAYTEIRNLLDLGSDSYIESLKEVGIALFDDLLPTGEVTT